MLSSFLISCTRLPVFFWFTNLLDIYPAKSIQGFGCVCYVATSFTDSLKN